MISQYCNMKHQDILINSLDYDMNTNVIIIIIIIIIITRLIT